MKITMQNGRVIISSTVYGACYSVNADEPAVNEYGNETGATWGEEFAAGTLTVVDDPTREIGGMHGAVIAALDQP